MQADFSLTLDGGRDAFPKFLDAIESWGGERGIPPILIDQMLLALDELISNILSYNEGEPKVEVNIALHGGRIEMEVIDDGHPFDPIAAPPPDTSLSVEDRPIGGLGIFLVRRMMDAVRYDRHGGRNRIRFHKDYPIAS